MNELILTNEKGEQRIISDPSINKSLVQSLQRQGFTNVKKGSLPDSDIVGGIKLPDVSSLPNISGGIDTSDAEGIVASGVAMSAADREKIKQQTEEQYAGQRDLLSSGFDESIGKIAGLGTENKRSLEAELGVGRRFSSSAQAFLQFIDGKYKEQIQTLEKQKQQALVDFDFKMASLIDQRIQNERQNQQQEFDNAIKIIEFGQKQREESAQVDTLTPQSEKDAAILSALNSGLTDIGDIFTAARNGGADVTLEDVTTALDSLGASVGINKNAAEKLTGDAKNFFLLKENSPGFLPTEIMSLPEDKQLGAYIKWMEDGGTFVSGSSGNILPGSNQYEQSILITRIGKSIYGTRISDKESERVETFIKAGMAQGKSQNEIIDDVLGYQIERNKPLAENLKNVLIANAGEDGLAGFDMLGLARLINSGKDGLAIQKAEDMAYKASKDIDPDNFISESAVKITTQQVNDLVSLLEGEGLLEEVGTFEGTITKLLTKKLRGARETEVLNRVQNLVAQIRKDLAGVAVTPTEMRNLEPLFPDIDQPASSFMVELNNLKTIPQLKLNQVRRDRNMPIINEEQLFDRNLRTPLYSNLPQLTDDDYFNSPIPTGGNSGGEYDPSVWDNIEI